MKWRGKDVNIDPKIVFMIIVGLGCIAREVHWLLN